MFMEVAEPEDVARLTRMYIHEDYATDRLKAKSERADRKRDLHETEAVTIKEWIDTGHWKVQK